jgi:hypothetical protein
MEWIWLLWWWSRRRERPMERPMEASGAAAGEEEESVAGIVLPSPLLSSLGFACLLRLEGIGCLLPCYALSLSLSLSLFSPGYYSVPAAGRPTAGLLLLAGGCALLLPMEWNRMEMRGDA